MATTRSYCSHCGNMVGKALRFCDECGASFHEGAQRTSLRFGRVVESLDTIPSRIEGIFVDYVFIEQLGEGGMGRVFRAMHCKSGQEFAVKVLHENLHLRRGLVNLFIKEAETQTHIVHPNVVRLFQLARDGDRLALILELVRGGASLDIITAKRDGRLMRFRQIFWLAGQMLLGLSVVHAHGFVHADVKPSNFIFGKTDHGETVLKIADFGIARSLSAELTGGGKRSSAGTPGYMAPEQILAEPLSPEADLYSLGCVLYELIAGCPVFPVSDIDELKNHHLHVAPVQLYELRPDVPSHLVELVHALLRKQPKQRPRSAEAVYAFLKEGFQ